ncbi:MAG: hypothetical protein NTV46_14295 [Verrucomicrobia bacterium]|nr:hypothetical protein [Verrucomicrobiota bacterium]
METPSPRYILTRAVFWIALLVAGLVGFSFVKKKQRQAAISAELASITSDSSFFQQFYAEDARKALVRAIGLLAEANSLGVPPDVAIDRGLGIQPKFFATNAKHDDPPIRERIIRACLRSNYQNFLMLGYKADFQTLYSMKQGDLPFIPSGPQSGSKPEIALLIPSAISPGMEKVIANLLIRPPQPAGQPASAIEIATAKQLACDLADARLIEEPVRDQILKDLSKPVP